MISGYLIKHKKILIILFAIALAVLIIPVISAGAYTYLCEDDFSFEAGARDLARDYGNVYVGAVHRMIEYYNSNQGTFLFNFLMSALHMYTRGGLPGLHVFMVLSLFMFFLALITLIRQLIQDWAGALGISFAAVLMLLEMSNTITNMEILFWYTGVLNMLVPLILSFISASLSLYNIRSGKIRYAVAGMILGFFASGCALNITSANCSWLLAILILSFPKIKENKTIVLPFAGAFIGAVINAVAPGNFNRLDGTSLHLGEGLSNTFMCYISDVKLLTSSRIFWFAIILSFGTITLLKIKVLPKGVSNLQLAIVIVGSFFVKFFSLFPVTFATGLNNMEMLSYRTFSSYEVVAKLMCIFITIIFAQWLNERKETISQYAATALIGIAALFLLVTYPATKAELKSGTSYMVIDDFRTGIMVENYNMREFILATLDHAEEGSDAIIYLPPFRFANSMYGMGLGEDSEWFVNRSAAGLFDLNSVTVLFTE